MQQQMACLQSIRSRHEGLWKIPTGGHLFPHTLPVFRAIFLRNLRKGKIYYRILLSLLFAVWLMTISVSCGRRRFYILTFRFTNSIIPSQDDPLTCNNHLATCAQVGNVIGCCTTDLDDCTAIPTTCIDYTETCGSGCRDDPETLICSSSYIPYCATYVFDSTAEFYGCYTTSGRTLQVTYLSEYYSSALGPDYTTYGDIGITTRPSSIASTGTTTDSERTSTAAGRTSESTESKSEGGGGDGGLSGGAIAGIVIGASAVVSAFAAFLIWVIVIKRKNNKNPPPPPATQPVQQIPPDGGVSPMAGSQQPGYDQPPPPMPYNQYNPIPSGYFHQENKIGPTSPTDPPQYNQPYNPQQGTGDASGYQNYNPGAPQQPQPPLGQQALSPAADYQNFSQNNSLHIPPGGLAMNEMEGSNNAPASGAIAPTQTEYELSANSAGPPEPIYEMPSAR